MTTITAALATLVVGVPVVDFPIAIPLSSTVVVLTALHNSSDPPPPMPKCATRSIAYDETYS
jgi:hypothetical protein